MRVHLIRCADGLPRLFVGFGLGWLMHPATHEPSIHLAIAVIAGMLVGYFWSWMHRTQPVGANEERHG